jgi:ankyrin repeat protein
LFCLENERLIRECCRNDVEAVKWLLENTEIHSIDLKKGVNRSALHEAVLHRDGRALVRLLCQHGADPKQRDSLGLFEFQSQLTTKFFFTFQVVRLFIMLLVMVISIS